MSVCQRSGGCQAFLAAEDVGRFPVRVCLPFELFDVSVAFSSAFPWVRSLLPLERDVWILPSMSSSAFRSVLGKWTSKLMERVYIKNQTSGTRVGISGDREFTGRSLDGPKEVLSLAISEHQVSRERRQRMTLSDLL